MPGGQQYAKQGLRCVCGAKRLRHAPNPVLHPPIHHVPLVSPLSKTDQEIRKRRLCTINNPPNTSQRTIDLQLTRIPQVPRCVHVNIEVGSAGQVDDEGSDSIIVRDSRPATLICPQACTRGNRTAADWGAPWMRDVCVA